MKHIDPKYFYTHEQLGKEVDIRWIKTSENRADLFTKPLPPALHRDHVRGIGMRTLTEIQSNPHAQH